MSLVPASTLLAVIFLAAGAPEEPGAPALPCVLSGSDARYFQAMLDDWAVITDGIFHLPSRTVPWIVLFDRGCAYHIAPDTAVPLARTARPVAPGRLSFEGRPVALRTLPAGGDIALPNGARVPSSGLAFTSVYGEGAGERPFFVTALPDVWDHDPRYAADTEDRVEFVRSVVSHELVHTLQMVPIRARMEALHARHPELPIELDDDLIQRRFAEVPGLDPTVRAEIALLFAAAAEPDGAAARELSRRALALVRARRTTYFADSAAAFGALEDLFLGMEGIACWGALRLALRRAPGLSPDSVLSQIRGTRKWWSQEEGLALFLLLDRLAPGAIARTLPPELAAPTALLDSALAAGP